ncbi:MAG: SoxR reducing system RseC family protein [Oscillospiraceae bacterium]|jgi:sigma-E factor negative regulatory protein RseC|nr:SoxR reducing system RseC family protein [Oscillospiraceae bacterium]
MRQYARVTALLQKGMAEISVLRESACSGDCHKCSGCGAAAQQVIVKAKNPIGAQPGQRVCVETDTALILRVSALVYLLPLALFFAGYFAGLALLWRPVICGLAAFVIGTLPALAYNRRLKRNPPQYVIREIVS